MIHGTLGLIIQALTLTIAAERGAVYAIRAWKGKGGK